MIDTKTAINILEDIEQCLYSDNWKGKTLSTVRQYKNGLLIATNSKIKDLIQEFKKYDENSNKAKRIAKKIDKEVSDIYNRN